MTTLEIRDSNFETLRESLGDRMADVYKAFLMHGACTTIDLAEKSGIGLLTLRPRTTDLAGLGLIEQVGEQVLNGKLHGVYAAREREAWLDWRAANFPVDGQLQMGLNNRGALTT